MSTILFTTLVVLLTVLPIVFSLGSSAARTVSDFRAAPSSFSGLLVSVSVIGTIIGGAMFVAVGQIGFEAGVIGMILGVVYLISLSMFGIFCAPVAQLMNDHNVETLVDLVEVKTSKRVAAVFSATNGLMYVALLGSQYVVAYTFFDFLQNQGVPGFSLYLILFVALASLAAYAVWGGIKRDIKTDVLQVLIVAIATFAILYLMLSRMSLSDVVTQLPNDHLTGLGYGWIYLVSLVVFIGPMIFVRPDVWQRAVALKKKKYMFLVFFITGLIACLAFVIFTFLGMWARVNYPNADPASATLQAIWSVGNYSVSPLIGLIVGGLFAAILSSADTIVNNATIHFEKATSLSFQGNSTYDEKRFLILRSITVLVMCAGLIFAVVAQDIVDLITASFSVLLIFLPMVVSFMGKNGSNERVAYYSAVVGLVFWFAAFFTGISPKEAFAPAVIASWIVYAVLSLVMRRARR